jgi:hypothetical protein
VGVRRCWLAPPGVSAATAAGLVLDAFGAAVLVFGLAFRRSWQTADLATFKYDFNSDIHIELAKQTADARVGATLLVAGFLGQLLAAVGVDCSSGVTVALAVCLAGAAGLLAVTLWRRHEQRVGIRRALLNDLRRKRREPQIWQLILDEYGPYIGAERGVDESPADYGKRVVGEDAWSELAGRDDLPDYLTTPWHESHSRRTIDD